MRTFQPGARRGALLPWTAMTLADRLPGAVVMAPMTKGSNLPYRRLCVELGARIT